MHFTAESANQTLEKLELHVAVRAALAELPASLREPLVLHYIESVPRPDVQKILDLSEATLHMNLANGLEKLRVLLTVRGVAVPAVGVPAILQSLPQPKVPPGLYAHILASIRNGGMHVSAAGSNC